MINEIKKSEPDISNLYRFPWSKNDHPCGWIEITTVCNMACPGCYRLCNQGREGRHKTLDEVKREIEYIIKVKNPDTIALNGGEPLTHPDIIEIINFVKKKGLRSAIYTNGRLLTREFLIRLKQAGLTGANIRINSFEKGKNELEDSLANLRRKYVELFKDVGGLSLVYTLVIEKKDLLDINDMIEYTNKNSEFINGLVVILRRDAYLKKTDKVETKNLIFIPELCELIKNKYPDLYYSAYLGSQAEDARIKWLWSFPIILNGKVIGYANKKFPEMIQTLYHFKKNRYFWFLENKFYHLSALKFIYSCFICKDRLLMKNYLKKILKNPINLFRKIYWQEFLIVQPPFFVDGKRDPCDPCTCSIVFNGKFYPACGVEEFLALGGKHFELKK
jgi:MoaA/NifB/PqqE/SkfB family radical SAM enzyme